MQIAENSVVTMTYTLTDDQGQVLDQADASQPFVYLHGSQNIISGLEDALTGKQANDSMQVTIAPEDAYGVRDERMTQQIPRDMFGDVPAEVLVPGAKFQAHTNGGIEVITIAAVDGDMITIDANHPLAGVTLTFDLTILDVRLATADELAHGHVHAHGGCGHDH
ncbi:MAG: peptidylprolyl isomerase [Gammaproteobacteria bacterium]|nr:peptidylprolyl isomerase [Gammaproteobacteria bacterium]MBU1722354.1 peptidylprolyl isomerase [Gammaproteobacteria bacterium]MBU2004709.1 peptidylprolyl isomerase [Gammaproteobacteria bacterium]